MQGALLSPHCPFLEKRINKHSSFFPLCKKRMSFLLQPRQIWNLILLGLQPQVHGFVQAFNWVQLTPRNQCCCCFEKLLLLCPRLSGCPPPPLQQAFPKFGLRNGRTVFLEAFNNEEKQIECILVEDLCTGKKKKVNEGISVQGLPVLGLYSIVSRGTSKLQLQANVQSNI